MQRSAQAPRFVVGHHGIQRIGRRRLLVREAIEHSTGALLCPLGVDEFRVGDPVQPGGQGRSTVEPGDFFPGGGKSLLREVLGLVNVACQVNQKTINGLVVGANQLGACLGSAGTEMAQQALLVRRRHMFSASDSRGPRDRLHSIGRTRLSRCWRKMDSSHCSIRKVSFLEKLGDFLFQLGRIVGPQFSFPIEEEYAWDGKESTQCFRPETAAMIKS